MSFILLPKVKFLRTRWGEYLLRECSLYDLMVLNSIFSHLQNGGELGEIEVLELEKILKNMLKKGELHPEDLLNVGAELVNISAENVIKKSKNLSKKETDPEECLDSGAFQMLHVLGARYGKEPVELSKQITYRQAQYEFVLCHNDTVTERKIAGCEVKEKNYINAQGMLVRKEALSDEEKMAYYGRLSLQRRKIKNEQ